MRLGKLLIHTNFTFVKNVFKKFECTVQTVLKDHPWEENIRVCVHRWSLMTGSNMPKMSNFEIKSKVAIDR